MSIINIPGSKLYNNIIDAKADCPGPEYDLASCSGANGDIWYFWKMRMEMPYETLFKRIDKLESEVKRLNEILHSGYPRSNAIHNGD